MANLTPKQQRFVDEYLIDLNATQAAIRAGYSEKTAKDIGCENLAKPNIKEAIEKAQNKRIARTEITQDMVLQELAKIGFSNMLDYMSITNGGDLVHDFSALTRDQAAAISEVVVEEYAEGRDEDKREVKKLKFKLADKKSALVEIGRHLGMFKDKVEHSGGITVSSVADLMDNIGDDDL
ncbi:terminase small subunit [Acinetobacter pollinis]|uniref:terminase small subunit n=1 Tax=Acinetobacter pollinis TaxID=2605270 RepID=UPI0018C1D610|nr:terminase small subunit [Acinetobacter pollinis]MBF7694036.1 terminase small subunit [Acinetobacter pollinis]MBF7701665.1 terminase small subunit [Acinetobacter pollinis]